jgi:hypothetical protein
VLLKISQFLFFPHPIWLLHNHRVLSGSTVDSCVSDRLCTHGCADVNGTLTVNTLPTCLFIIYKKYKYGEPVSVSLFIQQQLCPCHSCICKCSVNTQGVDK